MTGMSLLLKSREPERPEEPHTAFFLAEGDVRGQENKLWADNQKEVIMCNWMMNRRNIFILPTLSREAVSSDPYWLMFPVPVAGPRSPLWVIPVIMTTQNCTDFILNL